MPNHVYPGGLNVTTRNAAELLASDMYFMGTSVAATASAVAYDTKFSSVKSAILDSITESLTPYDDVIYSYKDTDEITITAGGKFTLADGTVKSFATNTDLSTSTNLTTDDTLTAGTFYYLWSNGTTTKFSDNGSAAPSDVSGGVKLRWGISIYNDTGTLKIIPFKIVGNYYLYNIAVACAGSDLTEVFDGAMSTTFLNVDCSAFAPSNARIMVNWILGYSRSHYWRCDGESHGGHIISGQLVGIPYEPLLVSGIYEAKNSGSETTRISIVGFYA